MSSKTTWGLIMAAGILFALIYFVERPLRQSRLQQTSRLILPGLDPAAVTGLSVHPANQLEIRAEVRSNSWRLIKPILYRADNQQIQSFLIGLSTLEWVGAPILAQDLKGRTNELEEFGFVNPQYSIEIRDPRGARTLRVGTNSAFGDKVFLQVGGSEVVYAAKADLLKLMPVNKDTWRDTELVRLDDISFDTVKVRSGSKTMELRRDAQGLWKLHTPLQARADAPKIDSLLSQLQSLRASSFVADETPADLEPYGLQASAQTPHLELSLLRNTSTNVLFSLQMGSSPTNHPELAYVRRQVPGNILLTHRDALAPWQAAYTNFLDRHLISGPADQVESIDVSNSEQFVVQRQEGGWRVHPVGAEPFPADAELMRFLVETLTNVQTEVEQTVVAAFENYGLAQPALVYTLRGASASGQTNLIARIEFGTNQVGRVFEHRADESSVNSMPADYYGRFPRAAWQLRDRRIWTFSSNNVLSVTVHQHGSTRKMIRDIDHEWTFAPGSNGKLNPLNPFSLDETLHRLGELTAVYWDGTGDANLEQFGFRETDHQVELEVKTATGVETLKIEFGKRSPYFHPYASVTLQGKRQIFEFPAPLYNEGVQADLTIAPSLHEQRRQ